MPAAISSVRKTYQMDLLAILYLLRATANLRLIMIAQAAAFINEARESRNVFTGGTFVYSGGMAEYY
jgi:hypothetical protein